MTYEKQPPIRNEETELQCGYINFTALYRQKRLSSVSNAGLTKPMFSLVYQAAFQ